MHSKQLALICLIVLVQACWAEKGELDTFLGGRRELSWNIASHSFDSHDSMQGSLSASPQTIQNGEDVTVSWSGIDGAATNDWIAIFCPGDVGSDQDYLDYLYTNSDSGSGFVVFENLINMRCDYGFRYYGGSKVNGRYPLYATSNPVTMIEGDNEVLQVHTSLTSDPSEMEIIWTTNSNQYDSVVYYGSSQTSLDMMASSPANNAQTYFADQMCGSPANQTSQQNFRDPGYIHSVTLSNLKANSIYYYQCGNDNEGWSPVYWMRTSSSSSNYNDSFTADINTKFIVYGDMGVTSPPGSYSTATRVTNEAFTGSQFVLHIGDVSYARGFAYLWEQFFALVESIACHIPYMVNIGNHEYDHTTGGENDPSGAPGEGFHPSWGNYGDDSSGECSVPMYYRFHAPDNGHGIYWYSFDYGNVHVIMMSTEHNYTIGSEQYQWIENDLKQVNRQRTPFVVFGGHRAMYESEAYPEQWVVGLGMRKSLEDLLFNYQVDIAFWGHYHAYERSCPVYQGKCNSAGTTHIVVGTAGFDLDSGTELTPEWAETFITDYGYCRVSTTRTEMTVQFIRNSNGGIADEVTLQSKF